MKDMVLHRAQITILERLRHAESARFSELLRATDMTSDVFKFHVRTLVQLGYIDKQTDGSYELTSAGKEFANNLDEAARTAQKQPKLSVILVVPEPTQADVRRYLFHERLRHPFYGFWGALSGPVGWGESVEEAASRELSKQTGLKADWTVRKFLRKRDYNAGMRHLLEDKLFTIVEAHSVIGELNNNWPHGRNEWLTAEEYDEKLHRFTPAAEVLSWVQGDIQYLTQDVFYSDKEY
jgi:ADP-ribose pyrophosphatase YjhB (NUDIX family)/predicted transcriptional regulator